MKNALLSLLLVIPMFVFGQQVRNNDVNVVNLGFEYGFHTPGGDLKDRFGWGSMLGGELEYLLKSNWSISIDASYIFGRRVFEDPINPLKGVDSLLIGNNFSQATIFLRQRGFYTGVSVGKLFPVSKRNKKSGIKVDLGVGLFQHKIRIQDDPESFVPILSGDYKKGYDRLTNGLALRQFVGYQHLANNRLLNVYAGFEFTQAFTQNRRTTNFDTMAPDNTKRLDLLSSFKVGWILPFYIGEKGEEIFY